VNKSYQYIIFDVDDTLLDFGAAFYGAQRDLAAVLGMEYSEEYIAAAEKCGYRAWRESGMENTSSPDVQQNYHRYYFDYLKKQCRYLNEEFGSGAEEDKLLGCYLESIAGSAVLMEPDTLDVCRALSERYRLVLATNGMKEMQTCRVKDFLPFVHRLYISEEIGVIKPAREFFDRMLGDLGCRPEECLMVGDSITNDILGAMAVGMDVCWYNHKGRPAPENVHIPEVIHTIGKLAEILL